jgi:cytochrome c-type biogenesis protein CcmH/NrfG
MRCLHQGLAGWPFAVGRNGAIGFCLAAWLLPGPAVVAAEIEEARALLLSGRYHECVVTSEAELKERSYSDQWRLVLVEGLWTLGRYPQARGVITNALAQESTSVRLRLRAREVFLSLGETRQAEAMLREVGLLVSSRPWAYREASDLVAIGRAALLSGSDPRQVMDRLYAAAKKADPGQRDVYLASGELALEKHDYALAARTFQEGLKKLPDDPDLHYGLARAYAPSEPALMLASIESALRGNSNHLGSLLLLADHLIDAEDYTEAGQLLERVGAVNPWRPEAWAYRAVIAHLQNEPQREQVALEMALKHWTNNPAVPHLVGRKLSQKYRFAEGASFQRQALSFDPNHRPAKAQLAEDLLRLGEEQEGWRLVEQVHQEDGYDVNALNLVTLRDTMAKYQTLTNQHFQVRMTPHEAALYGPRVLELLESARQRLCAKYGLDLRQPVLLEIFADQKDFAVRTFGLPENHGYLGVCFGPVVTANSPASRPGQRYNWEAVLWHEFTHVITLQLTRNKLPRWLSEGISVYEERLANPTWGEHLNPRYREMILEGALTPLSKLSAAFLTPRSELHLQFAYFQASLVVQFLVERFGSDKLASILADLGRGAEVNRTLEQHTAALASLEKDFEAYARRLAEQMAPGLDFDKPGLEARLEEGTAAGWKEWAKTRPTNFWVMTQQAGELARARKWVEARPILETLIKLYPNCTGSESPYSLLAEAHRAGGETNQERKVLEQWAGRDSQAVAAYERLMELGASRRDWPAVEENARRYLAVNPLVPLPYRFLAAAGEARSQTAAALQAYRALLQLDPPNPAEVHFKLARLLHQTGEAGARRHVLQALAEAPRYPAALRLLLEIHRQTPTPQATAPADHPAATP